MGPGSPPAARPGAGFRHEALLYAGEDEFLAAVVAFIRDGIERGEPVFAALAPDKISAVRTALGSDADQVEFADMSRLGQNPARILPAWRELVGSSASAATPRRGIGEPVWHGRSEVELIECQRHESLLNVAFDDEAPLWLLCPYDIQRLDPAIIDEARRNHPHVIVDGRHETVEPSDLADFATAYLDAPLDSPPVNGGGLSFGVDDIRLVRDHVAAHVVASGMSAARGFDLLVAVSEIATNSARHGGGQGILRVWHDGEALICEVSDQGLIADPLAGRREPSPEDEGSRGLWLANQLCDLVQMRVFESGTVIRLHMAVRPEDGPQT